MASDADACSGDPPRVWAPGKTFPGCAFTRSIGDAVAEGIGVIGEPEILTRRIEPSDRFLILACDGVWDVLSDQKVCDIVQKSLDAQPDAPHLAAKAVCTAAFSAESEDNISACLLYTSDAADE